MYGRVLGLVKVVQLLGWEWSAVCGVIGKVLDGRRSVVDKRPRDVFCDGISP